MQFHARLGTLDDLPAELVWGFEDQNVPHDLSPYLTDAQKAEITEEARERCEQILATSEDPDHLERAARILAKLNQHHPESDE